MFDFLKRIFGFGKPVQSEPAPQPVTEVSDPAPHSVQLNIDTSAQSWGTTNTPDVQVQQPTVVESAPAKTKKKGKKKEEKSVEAAWPFERPTEPAKKKRVKKSKEK